MRSFDLRLAFALVPLAMPFAVAGAQSPVGSGTWTIGGSARFSTHLDRGNDRRETGFQLSPDLGLFVVDNVLVSANLRFGWSKVEDAGSALTLGIGPGVSYYVSSLSRTVLPYATVRGIIQRVEFSEPRGSDVPHSTVRDVGWTAGVGTLLLFNRYVGLAIEAVYSDLEVTVRYDNGEGTDLRNTSSLIGLLFGLRVLLP